MKVNIIIAGFQKCGTTALHSFLSNHPKIRPSNPKELDFFNYEENFKRGIDFYHSNFNKRMFGTLRSDFYLEASPSYANDQDIYKTINRIKNYNNDIKIIIVVRNPVNRAYSAWNMYKERYIEGNTNWWFEWVEKRTGQPSNAIRRTEDEYKEFKLFIENEIKMTTLSKKIECSVLKNGNYYEGIINFKKAFGNNLLVVENENLNDNTGDQLKKIGDFLNLPPYDWMQFESKKVFLGKYFDEVDSESEKILKNYYYHSNKKLFDLTGINYL